MQQRIKERSDYLLSKGLNPSDVGLWSSKWTSLKASAKKKFISCGLTFQQYVDLALDADISDPRRIGRTIGSYQMGRFGDVGDYVVGNCRFITISQNLAERRMNGGEEILSKMRLGKTKVECDFIRKMSETMSNQTKENSDRVRRMAETKTGKTKQDSPHIAAQADKLSKNFRIVSPSGEIFTGRNLTEFCQVHGIHKGNMSSVCAGKSKQCKGWTGEYVEIING